jgi:predicted DNA-binding protein
MRIIKKQEIEELVNSDGGAIGGDRNVTSNSEIETGPVQKPWNDDSDYEKGVSTTTDRATRYRQNIPWFAVYFYRGSGGRIHEKTTKLTKKQLEEEIKEDLVKKSKKDGEFRDKNYNPKIEKIIDTIEDTDLTKDQLEKIKKTILDKINKSNA